MSELRLLEGNELQVLITVQRNLETYSGPVTFQYSTSDLTATGVDKTQYAACMAAPTRLRGELNCGDYEQTSGTLVMGATDTAASFTVNIVDDLCRELYMEYFQITLSVPGGGALTGEDVSMKVRIDDNDFEGDTCTAT